MEERALLAASLSLNPVAAINENDLATLTGSVSGLVANNNFALDVTWGDGSVGTINDTADASGNKSFSITHRYLDDQPSGTPADTYAIDVKLTEATINVSPDVIFVIDISGSTTDHFQGTAIGDQNGDGSSNTILDAEIAGFKSLNQELINRGLGDSARVSLTAFDSIGRIVDMDPSRAGVQVFTTPLADNDKNGVRDVDQALATLRAGGGTDFEQALQTAIRTLDAVGTLPGLGNVIFLSDGFGGGSFADEVKTITSPPRNQNLRAFGVGTGSSLTQLRQIDPKAIQFTTTDQLLSGLAGVVNNGGQIGGGKDQKSATVLVNNVAPTLQLNPVTIRRSGLATLSGTIADVGTLDTFTLRVDWGDPTSPSNVVSLTLPAGSKGFTLTHQYADSTPAGDLIGVTLTDDDTGMATASALVPALAPLNVLDVLVTIGSVAPVSILNETRVLPWLKVQAISFVFDDQVTVDQGDLTLTGVARASYLTTGLRTSYDPITNRTTATWTLPPLGSDGKGAERLTITVPLGNLGDPNAQIFTRTNNTVPRKFIHKFYHSHMQQHRPT